MRTSLRSAVWKEGAWKAGSAGFAKGIGLALVAAAFLAMAPDASADTITTEEPVVLANGETALEVTEITADAVTTVAGTTIKCKKVHGWHGL